jgi:hypothetical protein
MNDLSNFLYRHVKEEPDNSHNMQGFMHRHEKMEERLGLDQGHVIVDVLDWEIVRKNHEKRLNRTKHKGSISKIEFINKK